MHVCVLILCIIFLVWVFVSTYLRLWMYWHLGRASKHSSSIEHAPMSSPMPLSPAELTTKARASISLGNSRMLRSSRVGLVPTTFLASWWSWLSWTQWQSSSIWEDIRRQNQEEKRQRREGNKKNYVIVCQVFTSVHSTLGPVRVLLWHKLLSSFRTRACRFWTQLWTPFPPNALANWTKAWVHCWEARPHTYKCRESVKTVLWSDLVVQRVFRLNLTEQRGRRSSIINVLLRLRVKVKTYIDCCVKDSS